MIHYLATAGHDRHTMRRFRRWWAGPLADRIRIHAYERLPGMAAAEPGLYVFSDLERLRPHERAAAAELHARLLAAGPAFRVLNDPLRALRRRELLAALHERGVNPFRAWPAMGPFAAARFPVFVRAANAHEGSFTGLLRRPEEVEPAIRRVLRWHWRYRREDLLVVEFQDTADASGTFRKYSAMRIGPVLLARHLLHGDTWVVKKPERLDAARLAEEQEFLDSFPHRDQVASAFEIAGIEYGRIDYAVLNGRVVVWEINTNPVVIPHPRRVAASRLARNLRFAEQVIEALSAIEAGLPPGPPLP
ncbi:MAG: hypothetical protein ACHQ1G_10875, partial [Planctomycetota bacterium]